MDNGTLQHLIALSQNKDGDLINSFLRASFNDLYVSVLLEHESELGGEGSFLELLRKEAASGPLRTIVYGYATKLRMQEIADTGLQELLDSDGFMEAANEYCPDFKSQLERSMRGWQVYWTEQDEYAAFIQQLPSAMKQIAFDHGRGNPSYATREDRRNEVASFIFNSHEELVRAQNSVYHTVLMGLKDIPYNIMKAVAIEELMDQISPLGSGPRPMDQVLEESLGKLLPMQDKIIELCGLVHQYNLEVADKVFGIIPKVPATVAV